MFIKQRNKKKGECSMLFYKAEGTVKDGITNVERGYSGTGESGMFSQISDSFYYKHEESVYVFVATLKHGKITMGIVSDEPCDVDSVFVLSYKGIEENCSFASVLSSRKEEIQDKVRQILFG